MLKATEEAATAKSTTAMALLAWTATGELKAVAVAMETARVVQAMARGSKVKVGR